MDWINRNPWFNTCRSWVSAFMLNRMPCTSIKPLLLFMTIIIPYQWLVISTENLLKEAVEQQVNNERCIEWLRLDFMLYRFCQDITWQTAVLVFNLYSFIIMLHWRNQLTLLFAVVLLTFQRSAMQAQKMPIAPFLSAYSIYRNCV